MQNITRQRLYRIRRRKNNESPVTIYLSNETQNKVRKLAARQKKTIEQTYAQLIEGGLSDET